MPDAGKNILNGGSEKRAKGKARFVIQGALIWIGSMIVVTSIADLYFDGMLDGAKLFSRAIYFLIAGFVLGFVEWWDNEGRYRNAKIEARINSIEKQLVSDTAKQSLAAAGAIACFSSNLFPSAGMLIARRAEGSR